MLKRFKEEFKQTHLFQRMLNHEDVIIAYITGSQLTGITDERSDIDILCLTTTDVKYHEAPEYILWNGIKVHYNYHELNEHILTNNPLAMLSNIQIHNLCDNNALLYCKDGWQKHLNKYLKYSRNLLENGTYKLYYYFENMVNEIIKDDKQIEEKHFTKFLYHLCYAKQRLFNEILDKLLNLN